MANVHNVPETIQVLLDCLEENKNSYDQSSPSISMVPKRLRDRSPKSFNPSVVSIGPLHHRDEILQAFEGQKATGVYALLHGLELPPKETLRACVEKVNGSIPEIRECYVGMEPLSDVELAKMMVMDGCFILQFLRKFRDLNAHLAQTIFNDLLLVENQIPFFVLEYIFECTVLKLYPTTASLTNMLFPILDHGNPFEIELTIDPNTTHCHILGLLHKGLQPPNAIESEDDSVPEFHSVVELERAGVSFKPNRDTKWLMAMKVELPRFACFPWFGVNPTLRMPLLNLNDFTEMHLRNLIGYEQSSSLVPNYVTSYTIAMDMLINTPQDIAHLVESKAIINCTGSNEEAANMINNISNEAAFTDFFYSKQWQQLDSYYNRWWPKRLAWLRRTYFNSPWNLIALLGAIMLFVLTVVQTIYAVKAC